MRSKRCIGGQEFKEMLAAATEWLEHNATDIDALNVFPVPDGDTGSNMLLSMRSALNEALGTADDEASSVMEAFVRGALQGARGNSGVILSQFWQGLAWALQGKKAATCSDLSRGIEKACALAYEAVSEPVPGTILTVIKDIDSALKQESLDDEDVTGFMSRVVETANRSVADTPRLLPLLKEAGVVDAGGQGLYIILEGALHYLRGETSQTWVQRSKKPMAFDIPHELTFSEAQPYGFCTEFLLRGNALQPGSIRTFLEKHGHSLIIVGNERTVRVHIHTQNPNFIIKWAGSLGQVDRVSIRDMDRQHQAYVRYQKHGSVQAAVAVVAVAPGDGFSTVFKSLGAAEVIDERRKGLLDRDSFTGLLAAIPADEIIVVPNSEPLYLALKRAEKRKAKKVVVLPAFTIPQGISSLVAYNPEDDFQSACRHMKEAIAQVRSIEICRGERALETGRRRKKVNGGAFVGRLDGQEAAAGDKALPLLERIMGTLDMSEASLITLYYGAEVPSTTAGEAAAHIKQKYPSIIVETFAGGHPDCDYIVSVE